MTPPPASADRAAPAPRKLPALSALPTWLHVSDVQGLAQLATQATLGVTGLAESVQGNVYKALAATLGPLGARFIDRTPGSSGVKPNGVTGLVYGGVRGVTRLAGGTLNAVLSRVAPLAGKRRASAPQREAMLSVLNGVLGDHLLATGNPLAIGMGLRSGGAALTLERPALAAAFPHAGAKVMVLVHGLCMNDLQWNTGAAGYSETLARELGYTLVYLHYNSGLPINVNGKQFAAALEQLLQAWPQAVQELVLLTHSMGGLVARSACQHGEQAGQGWLRHLRKLVFLGTPHTGAPLEVVGGWVDALLAGNMVTRPFTAIGKIRSAGITDLRAGHVADAGMSDALPADVHCYALAASLSAAPAEAGRSFLAAQTDRLLGDGLVPVASALGLQAGGSAAPLFTQDRQATLWKTGHVALLHAPAAGRQLRAWLLE